MDASTYSPALVAKLQQTLKQKYGIDLVTDKFISDKSYRDLVLGELALLDDAEVNAIISSFSAADETPAQVTPLNDGAPTIASEKQQKSKGLFVVIASILALVLAGGAFMMTWLGSPATQASNSAQANNTPVRQQPVTPQPQNAAKTSEVNPAPAMAPQLAFRIHGSNTIGEKLAPALLQGYLSELGASSFEWHQGDVVVERELHYSLDNQPFYVELHAHGSSTGFADILAGKADVAMSSRPVKDAEIEKLQLNYGNFGQIGNEHIIGLDGLAVIVNQNNSVSHLSTEQLADIFAGKISNWQQLGGANAAISLYARDGKSGTWDTFKNLVLKKHQAELSPTAKRFESSSELSQKVSQDEHAIGFIGLNYIMHNKSVAISEGEQTSPIYPTRFTIGTEDYALSRRLFVYTPTSASMLVKNFAHYAISQQGQDIVADTGLISQNINLETVTTPRNAPQAYQQYTQQGERLSLTFRFKRGSGQLDNKGKRDLERLLTFLDENPSRRIVLMGFSDNSGSVDANVSLSAQRAQSVAQELSARGISVFDIQGFGQVLPVASNQTQQGRERNRRVEVWVL